MASKAIVYQPKVDIALSHKLIKQSGLKFKDRECFGNSALLALLGFNKGMRGLRYVEGWAVSDYGLVTHHGWVQCYSTVIEVTPIWLEMAVCARNEWHFIETVEDRVAEIERTQEGMKELP